MEVTTWSDWRTNGVYYLRIGDRVETIIVRNSTSERDDLIRMFRRFGIQFVDNVFEPMSDEEMRAEGVTPLITI
jgi:hypothetical protein